MHIRPKYRKEGDLKEVLIVDDHELVRTGLTQILQELPDIKVTGQAEDAEQAWNLINLNHYDLVIVDISLKQMTGIQLTEKIKSKYPHLPVLIVSIHDESLYARRSLRSGARGYVAKSEPAETILDAVNQIIAGKIYLSGRMLEHFRSTMHESVPDPEIPDIVFDTQGYDILF